MFLFLPVKNAFNAFICIRFEHNKTILDLHINLFFNITIIDQFFYLVNFLIDACLLLHVSEFISELISCCLHSVFSLWFTTLCVCSFSRYILGNSLAKGISLVFAKVIISVNSLFFPKDIYICIAAFDFSKRNGYVG